MNFASIEAELSELQGDGHPLRAHLQRVAETGREDTRLFNECPREVLPLWVAYTQIGRCRSGGLGAGAISLQEVESWQRLTGVTLTPWELDAIIELDAVFMRRLTKKKG